MSHYQNTKNDFWNTLDFQKSSIVCPCCGKEMSLLYSASYELKFTANTCEILNHQLGLFRQTIIAVENALRRHNSLAINFQNKDTCYIIDKENLKEDGGIKSEQASGILNFLENLDMEKIDTLVSKIPYLSSDEKTFFAGEYATAEKFLRLFEPPHLNGGLIDITFDQPVVDRLITEEVPPMYIIDKMRNLSSVENNSKGDAVYNQIQRKLPTIFSYCIKYAQKKQETQEKEKGLFRLIAILEVYFGDTEQAKDTTEVIEKFSFGNYSIFRNWTSLAKLITSSYFVTKLQPQFSKYCSAIIGKEKNVQDALNELNSNKLLLGSNGNKSKLDEFLRKVPELKEVILYVVDFVCAGTPATIPSNAKYIKRMHNKKIEQHLVKEVEMEAEICGWVPKDEPTESLLLVGGTASSKTTLLQSTIVQVKRAASKLDMIFEPCSPLSKLLLEYFEQHYDSGMWSGATETGSRTSLQIKLFQAKDPSKVSYLVLNDIAGEKFEEMLRKEKDFEEIQSPLKNANNIIFLFDLVAWRHLMSLINSSTGDNWQAIKAQNEKHAADGRGIADSHDLLINFISKIKQCHGRNLESGELIDRTFMLVIPKADLYIDENMFLRPWITKLEKAKYIKAVKASDEEEKRYMMTWDFPMPDADSNETDSNKFVAALKVIEDMSHKAEEAIKEVAGNQDEETEAAISEKRIAEQVEATLIYLQKTFEDVKVVPVSALGQNPEIEKVQNSEVGNLAEKEFSCKAIPFFCEALLLLPIIKNYSENDKS